MKLSDYVVLSDMDIKYAKIFTGFCCDCKKKIERKKLRCPECSVVKIKSDAKKSRIKCRPINRCMDCSMEMMSKSHRCAECKVRHLKEYAKKRYDNDKKMSKFYVPPSV